MNAKELRIGNLIKLTDTGEIITVTGIMQDSHGVKVFGITSDGTYCNPWIENCEPITLTEDWLIRSGFVKDNNDDFDDFIYEKNMVYIFQHKYNLSSFNYPNLMKYGDLNEYKCATPIYYVHQLQNLYFALTGSELEINY